MKKVSALLMAVGLFDRPDAARKHYEATSTGLNSA